MNKNILFISNGFAEDLGAIAIIKELQKIAPELNIYALPIVGQADHFKSLNIKIIGPHWELPSQGFIHEKEHYNMLMDIKAGAIWLILGQIWAVLKNRKKFDLVIGIGDYVSIMVNGLLIKKPFFYVWTTLFPVFPKSVIKYMKKYGRKIFPRFKERLNHLDESGTPKEYVGNPIMDAFDITGEDFGLNKGQTTIGILPGSRDIVYQTLPLINETIKQLNKKDPNLYFLIALSPKLEKERFTKLIEKGIESQKYTISSKFGDILNRSDLVIGLGGTGCEQAACLGKPVITFWGEGISRTQEFVTAHASTILKESAILVEPKLEVIVETVLNLLNNPEKIAEIEKAGKRRMGPRGASKIIAQRIKDEAFGINPGL